MKPEVYRINMAEELEKQQLLKDIRFLTDLIKSAKQKDAGSAVSNRGPQHSSSGNTRRQNLCHTQCQGSGISTSSCKKGLPHLASPHKQVQNGPQPQSSKSVTSHSSTTASVNQKLPPKCLNKSSSLQNAMPGSISESSASTSQEAHSKNSKAAIAHGINHSTSSNMTVPICLKSKLSATVAGSIKNRAETSDKTILQTSIASPATTMGAKVQSSVRNINVWDAPSVKGNSSLLLQTLPAHPSNSSVPAYSHSSRKVELISKSSQVMAAREIMQNKLDGLKLHLAKLEAAKKKQALATGSHPSRKKNDIKTKGHSKSNEDNRKQDTEVDEEKGVQRHKKETDTTQNGMAFLNKCQLQPSNEHLKPTKRESSEFLSASAVTAFEKEKQSAKQHPAMVGQKSDPQNTFKAAQSKMSLLPYSKPSSSTFSDRSEPVAAVHVRETEKSASQSPSKVSAKVANLEKELKATEVKLSDMRKKIGVMLKESPQKSRQLKSSLAAASQQQRTDLLTISVAAAIHGCVPKEGTYAVCRSMPQESQPVTDNGQRPFPNRTSLRWTPQTSPLQTSSSETLLVVGSSPSVRIPHKSSYKVDSSKLKQSETRTSHSSQPHSGQKRNSLVVKKSRFCLRRTPSGATSSTPKEYPPANKLLPVQNSLQSGGAKPFVGRYKLQRLNRGSPKAAISGKNPQGKFTVASRYKLIKSGSREMPSTQQVSRSFTIPRTASQRAARVIKSKYKIRTVPLPVSPAYHSLPKKQLQYSSNYHKDRSYNSCQPFAWKTKTDKYNNMRYSYVTAQRFPFQSTSAFALAAAIKGQYPFRRNTGGNSAMFFYGGPWSGRKTDYYSSKQWWTNPYQRTSSYQQSQRAKAVAAWKRQQKMNALAAGLPYNHWQTKVFEAKREQQRKRLLLKRLQWMKKYNLTRKRLNRRESSPTKSSLQDSKQENLVMINGILYKSSSRRLTKASSSATKFRASASASAFGSASQTKLSSAVVVRNVKQHKMQTVTVRGISFTVDSRGTKLRRVQSSTEQDKSAAVSRVDVGGTTYIQNKEGILEKISDNQSRSVINRVKQRSIARVAAKFKKDNTKSKKKNCLFYSRFGKCSRGDSCPFLHDPEKIAVCTRFLRGTCKVENCPFSHKVSKEKMPVCAFFLRGVCTRENCPYLHVKVSQGAEICKDFVNGFCPLAEKCQKMHTLTCPHFAKTGVCPEGKKCRLLHRKVNRRQKQRATSPGSTSSDIISTDNASMNTKRPADSNEGRQAAQDMVPPLKRLKPNPESSSEAQACDSCSTAGISAEAHTASDVEEELPPTDEDRFKSSHLGEEQRDRPPQKPAKLPAFISLADYSLEESPIVKLQARKKTQSISGQKKGPSLQIKPRL